MYLIDTNIVLEGLLNQEKADSVARFFLEIDLEDTYITDISAVSQFRILNMQIVIVKRHLLKSRKIEIDIIRRIDQVS